VGFFLSVPRHPVFKEGEGFSPAYLNDSTILIYSIHRGVQRMHRSGYKKGNLTGRLWELDPETLGGPKGKSVRVLQFLSFVTSNFMANNSMLRASALSFTTLLSFVPLFALAFSLLKGLGAQNRLAPLILTQVAAGSEIVVNRILSYINNTNMGSLGAIGLATLLFTAISMLGSIEDAFNVAWGVSETRSFYRKFSDYLSVLLSAPLLLLAATSITTSLQSKWLTGWIIERTYLGELFFFLLGLTPYLSVWIALLLLYVFIPNTRVRPGSALLGAVLAGTLWQFAQWGYIHFQVGVGNYNAIYGTLAVLPILMVWVYVSWLIVLFGMEVVAAHQQLHTFRRDLRGGSISQSCRELVALATLRHIARAFHDGSAGWGDEQLAGRIGVPLRIMRDILQQLCSAGFIVPAGNAAGSYLPARELDQIALDQVLQALRGYGAACLIGGEPEARELQETVDRGVSQALEGITLKEFATQDKVPPGVDK
jgi:membrane protein